MTGKDNSTELAMMATEESRDVYRFKDFTLLIQRMVGMAKVVCYGRLVYLSVCFPFCPCFFFSLSFFLLSCNFLFFCWCQLSVSVKVMLICSFGRAIACMSLLFCPRACIRYFVCMSPCCLSACIGLFSFSLYPVSYTHLTLPTTCGV